MNMYYASLYIAVALASIGQLLLKAGAMRETKVLLGVRFNALIILGILLLGGSVVLSVLGMQVVPLRDVAAIIPLAYVFVPLLSRAILKEPLTKKVIVGTMFIVIGMVLFNTPILPLM